MRRLWLSCGWPVSAASMWRSPSANPIDAEFREGDKLNHPSGHGILMAR
ncbi:MAG: hypothetical protein WBX11_04555 [Thiobacillaceae bacterium]